jgi:hypothetical protein
MDDPGWLKILFIAFIAVAGLVKMIHQALSKSSEPAPPKNQRTRPITEFLEEVRREIQTQGHAPPPAAPKPAEERGVMGESAYEAAAAPTAEPALREDSGTSERQPPREVVPRTAPAPPHRSATPVPSPPVRIPRDAAAGRRRAQRAALAAEAGTSAGAAGSQRRREAPVSQAASSARAGRTLPVAQPRSSLPTLVPGLDLRQAIIAQVILGPPRAFQHGGIRRRPGPAAGTESTRPQA